MAINKWNFTNRQNESSSDEEIQNTVTQKSLKGKRNIPLEEENDSEDEPSYMLSELDFDPVSRIKV